jgi:YVTN family beta-propeller protein
VKSIGFLSFGHWSDTPHSQTRTASDALPQAIDLAVAAEELGGRRLLPGAPYRRDSSGKSCWCVATATLLSVSPDSDPREEDPMRPDTGPLAGSACLAPSRRWIGSVVGTALAATALAVFNPAPELAMASAAPAGSLLYVSNGALNNTITAYDLDTGTTVATIPTQGAVLDLAFSPDATTVYATEVEGYLAVINVATNTITASIPVGTFPANYPEGLAVSPDGGTVYVTNYEGNTVSVVNTSTDTVTATIPVGSYPQGVAVSPDGSTVYAANHGDGTISVISAATDTVTGTIALGANTGPSYVAFTPSGATAYVTGNKTDAVSVISTATEAVAATIPVGANPNGLTVTPNGRSAYVANFGGGVSVIDTSTNTVTTTIPTSTTPVEVANYPIGGSVYVSSDNNTSNGVSEINTSTNAIVGVLPNIPTGWGLAISPNPQVTRVSPDAGSDVGGNRVTITGVGFQNVLAVTFSGVSATSYTVTSPTTITATVPPGRPGPAYVAVTTYRGSSEATPDAEYFYQIVPTVTSVSPNSGYTRGGNVVTITGTGFSGPVSVMFGARSARIYRQSATQLQVIAPPGIAHTTVNITVSTTVGTSATSSADLYTYIWLVFVP